MQVTLTPHGEELLKAELARSAGSSPEEILERALQNLAALPIRVIPSAVAQLPAILSLAKRYRLTAYDAAYLDLTQRAGLPLATLDADLRKAAAATGATLVELEP